MNSAQVAAALRILANAFEAPETETQPAGGEPPAQKRGRGRPVKGEESATGATGAVASTAQAATIAAVTTANPAVTQTTAPAAAVAEDPFDSKPAAPTRTLDQVRSAWTELKNATSQENALKVMQEAGGASNGKDLKAEKYDAVYNALVAALPKGPKAPEPETDPFGGETAPAKAPTAEDVRLAVVETQKRTSQDAVQKVVMQHGGKAATPGGDKPSLKALPESAYATVIAALKAFPSTKG